MRFYFATEKMAHWFFERVKDRRATMQAYKGGYLLKVPN